MRQLHGRLSDAMSLIRLGARVGLVVQLTGLDRRTVIRLYREMTGRAPTGGQSPYTDSWYYRDDRRLIHAAHIWRIHRLLADRPMSDATRLILTFDAYRALIAEPVLDLTHAAAVLQLVAAESWHDLQCDDCGQPFLRAGDDHNTICPGCRRYYRRRCTRCDTPTRAKTGRPLAACRHCGARNENGIWVA